MARAFSLWLILRHRGQTWHYTADVITEFAKLTGNSTRAVRRWLDAGDGIFWLAGRKRGKATISLRGKNRVFASYMLDTPGRVALLPVERLTGRLQDLHAVLFSCHVQRDSKFMSRAKISQQTNTSERSQRTYDRLNDQHKQFIYRLDGSGDAKQTASRYHANYRTPMHVKRGQRFGLYTADTIKVTCGQGDLSSAHLTGDSEAAVKTKPKRVLYDNANEAVKRASQRAKRGDDGNVLVVTSVTRKGNVLVRNIGYGDGRVFA